MTTALPAMLTVERVRTKVERLYVRRCLQWLDDRGGAIWPLRVVLGAPNEAAAVQDMGAVRRWVSEWHDFGRIPGADLVWVERHWKRLGSQRLPKHLLFDNPEGVARFVDGLARWETLKVRHQALIGAGISGPTAARTAKNFLESYSSEDFVVLLNLLSWARNDNNDRIYLRQIPVHGLDTKWIEQRRALVEALLRDIFHDDSRDLYSLLGLRRPPSRVRLLVLDPALRTSTGGLSDIEAPIDEIAMLDLQPRCVIVSENVEPGLALQDHPATVAILGLGYAVDALGRFPWLSRAIQILYWGDIDTHGFACLARARQYVPGLRSVLMDEATLLANQSLWVEESVPATFDVLGTLDETEFALYEALRVDRWARHVRLEQERIPQEHVHSVLAKAMKDID